MTTLKDLSIGQSAKIISVGGKGATRQHLLDMGIIPETIIKFEKLAPLGDPMEFSLRGYSLSLRKDDAKTIKVELCQEEQTYTEIVIDQAHPGFGEEGYKYHNKKTENPLPDNTLLTFALVGNQNAGKTTLFNQLTGSNQHVGNFPGVTVDRKDGQIRKHTNTLITDLPGIYSMSPYTPEEIVSRNFILNEKPKGIINVLDATSIERGLYLTMQLLELDIPMVLALNMMDEINDNGGYININGLEKELGIPVVPISAAKNEGIDELIEHAIHVSKYQEKPIKQDFCDETENGGQVHRCLHSIMSLIEDHAKASELPLRFCASKCAENDIQIMEMLKLDKNEIDTIEHITKQMESERKLDKAACIADMRYSYIHKATKNNIIKPNKSKQQIRSSRIDRILTGKWTAIPCFIAIMLFIFFITFNVVGPYLQNVLEFLISLLANKVDLWMSINDVNSSLHSLVIDGIFNGVGSVLSFLPIIVILFFFLSILEDSGYMARIAFVMDKLLRRIGLSGRSIVPLIIGFGCSVPAVMSARTLPSKRDRTMTILLTPFMSCSAKLPIYAFFAKAFFHNYAGLVMSGLYFIGIIVGILVALLFKNSMFKGEPVPFVMELPSYRLPSIKNVWQLLWEKIKDFLQRAFTVIFVATIIIWFLQNHSFSLSYVTNPQESILAIIANIIAPIFKPCGFAYWQVVVALVTGFLAKESVVSTLQILSPNIAITSLLSSASALSLLVFCLLYVPCIAAISAIKQELGNKYALFVAIFQCVIAWIMSFITYLLVSMFL